MFYLMIGYQHSLINNTMTDFTAELIQCFLYTDVKYLDADHFLKDKQAKLRH
jgi:hypothetical protein